VRVLAADALNYHDRPGCQLEVIAPPGLEVLLSSGEKGWLDRGRAGLHRAARRPGMAPLWVPAPRHDCNMVILGRPRRLAVLDERRASGHRRWHAQASRRRPGARPGREYDTTCTGHGDCGEKAHGRAHAGPGSARADR